MLPKENRLKSKNDFEKIFKHGKVAEDEFMKIKFFKNSSGHSRFGFIVNSKFASKASARNLIKRRLRAAVYFLLRNIKPGFDIVIWPKTALKKVGYQVMLNQLKNLLIKNDILFI
jgi:ribonuclease P protein component